MAKTALFTAVTGPVVPSLGVNSVELTSFNTDITVGAEFIHPGEQLTVVQLDTAGTAWEAVTDAEGVVVLSIARKQFKLEQPGVYALRGSVSFTTTGYKLTEGSSAAILPVIDVDAATYTVLDTDHILGVSYTATGACTITLPTALVTAGRTLIIKDTGLSATTSNITFECEGGELIDGAATLVLDADGDSSTLFCDGTSLFTI